MREENFHTDIPRRIHLIVFCLLVMSFMISPILAEEQTNTQFHLSMQIQNPQNNSLAQESRGPFLKASAGAAKVDHTAYVGQLVSIDFCPPTPGTISFQRSKDAIHWQEMRKVATGASGCAVVSDYTETSPGIFYYRAVTDSGMISNTITVEWLQNLKTFSMTCIENYDTICGEDGKHCTINGTFEECENIRSALKNRGYTENFYLKDDQVIPENFATNPSYTGNKLTDSAFHYHSGHGADGSKIPLGITTATYLQLKKWDNFPNPLAYTVSAGDVTQKWGGNNKWVMLDSCNLLKDKNWGKALTTSHGILGYSTDSWVHQDFGDMFFGYAIDQKRTIVDAYKLTTIEVYNSDKINASVLAKNRAQIEKDQFPGIEGGHMEPDGDPNQINRTRYNWNCREGGKGWWD